MWTPRFSCGGKVGILVDLFGNLRLFLVLFFGLGSVHIIVVERLRYVLDIVEII